ncbi:glycoside hydrolase superfamily [Fusarium sp. MPI-SDFR-AT-0072]|nr:glycoside hydrolase superfamily [Fusarium sp. MPI-SDFR-AT-0072]
MGSIDRDVSGELSIEDAVNLLSGQDFWRTRANEALSLGSLKFSDGPNGVRGASFDVELVTKLAGLLARECKRKGVHGLLTRTMNIHRYLLCRRNFQSFGEDPLLSGLVAASFVNGLQAQGIATSPKHFLANEAENGRRCSDSVIEERALREIYLEPFRIVVEQAVPWCIVTAYNSVNGSFFSESQNLLSILRDEWRYSGAVISDWFGTYSTTEAFNAGLDLEMPGPTEFREYNNVLEAIKMGEVQKHQITDSATRVIDLLRKTGRVGELGLPPPLKAEEPDYLDDLKLRMLIRQAAESSMVLLNNEGDTLPLVGRDTRLAVFVHHATEPSLFGGRSASLKVPYSSTPWDALKKTYSYDTLGAGVAVNRLVPLPNESGLDIENIALF